MQKGIETITSRKIAFFTYFIYDPTAEMQKGIETLDQELS
jgi:hypothetical protein